MTWKSPGIGEDGWYEAIRCTCPPDSEREFEGHLLPYGQVTWLAITTEGRLLPVTIASIPVSRKAPELAHEADILIVGFFEERRDFPQFRHQQVYAASSPLTARLVGRRFRRAYYTDRAQSIRGFNRIEDVLHLAIANGLGEAVVHVSSYERLAEHNSDAELLRSLRQARAFEA
ncbi:hypothetical protein ACQPW3_36445 [Actinosynnema sp. CA-248983]